MSYTSPSDDLDEKEICEFLKHSNELSIPDLVRMIWKAGYEWGYEVGLDED